MIPAYQSFDPKKIDQMLSARLEALGIPAEALDETVGDGTLRQLICDLVAETLAEAGAEAQRDLYDRQRAGRIAAQQQGVNLGRPSKKCSDKRFAKIRGLYESQQITAEQAAQRLHVSVSTFYRWRGPRARLSRCRLPGRGPKPQEPAHSKKRRPHLGVFFHVRRRQDASGTSL